MQTVMDEREFLDVKETARFLRVHPATVYRAVADGRLPVVRLGDRGAIRVPAAALTPKGQRSAPYWQLPVEKPRIPKWVLGDADEYLAARA